jgi:hypothetical protein
MDEDVPGFEFGVASKIFSSLPIESKLFLLQVAATLFVRIYFWDPRLMQLCFEWNSGKTFETVSLQQSK